MDVGRRRRRRRVIPTWRTRQEIEARGGRCGKPSSGGGMSSPVQNKGEKARDLVDSSEVVDRYLNRKKMDLTATSSLSQPEP